MPDVPGIYVIKDSDGEAIATRLTRADLVGAFAEHIGGCHATLFGRSYDVGEEDEVRLAAEHYATTAMRALSGGGDE